MARLLHWIYAPSFIALIFSGLYINNPARGYGFRTMNAARKTHFIAQFSLLFSFLARIYYSLYGKNYKEFIPSRRTIRDLPGFLKYELFLTSKQSKYPKYNPGQKILFSIFVLLVPLQIITGLSMYNANSWQESAALAGGLNPLRKIHFVSALGLCVLICGHLYLALTHGLKKLKSIFTGYE